MPPDLQRGEFLVFIHGAGSSRHTWQRQLDAFAGDHSPLAFDFPGHGRSGGTESLKSVEAYRDCLAAFLAAVQPRPAVLVGRSMGGAVAMAYALAYPQRVRYFDLVACRECNLTSHLATIAVPRLVVAGRDDTITPVACSEAIHRTIPGSQLIVVDDAGHSLTTEKPAEFNAAVRQFLSGLEPQR